MEATLFPATAHRAGHVRELTDDDLPRVDALCQRVFPHSAHTTAFHHQLFVASPWHGENLPSLVYEDASGKITGCLGVMPRLMAFRGRRIRVAVGHHFMVDPDSRSALAGMDLARRFFSGPQDLSLAEGNELSQRIWEFFGGSICLLSSLTWTRALRPCRYALTLLERRGLGGAVTLPLLPMCSAVDAAMPSLSPRLFRIRVPPTVGDELDAPTLAACLSSFLEGRALRPLYSTSSVEWLLERLQEKQHRGRLHTVAVRERGGRLLGWFLYYLSTTRIAEVVQFGGRSATIDHVLDHLFSHARQHGAAAVCGQLDPGYLAQLSARSCVFHRPAATWTLVHARDPQLLGTLHAGHGFLTRMESEWWIAS